MAERQRFHLTFHLNRPEQRRAWEILRGFPPGERKAAVCRMICGYQEQDRLIASIRELLKHTDSSEAKQHELERAGEIGDDVLGFLRALQQDS